MFLWNPKQYPVGPVALNPFHELHDDINEAWWLDGGMCVGLKRGLHGTAATSGVSQSYQTFGPAASSSANTDNYTLPGLGLGAWTELSILTCIKTGPSSSGNIWTDCFDISGTGENVAQLAYEFFGPNLKFGFSLGAVDIVGTITSAYSTNYLWGISTKQSGNQLNAVLNMDTGAFSSDSVTAHTTNSTGALGNRICGATASLGFKGSMQFLVLFNRQLTADELKMLVLGPRYALFAPKKLLRRSPAAIQIATYGIGRKHFIGLW